MYKIREITGYIYSVYRRKRHHTETIAFIFLRNSYSRGVKEKAGNFRKRKEKLTAMVLSRSSQCRDVACFSASFCTTNEMQARRFKKRTNSSIKIALCYPIARVYNDNWFYCKLYANNCLHGWLFIKLCLASWSKNKSEINKHHRSIKIAHFLPSLIFVDYSRILYLFIYCKRNKKTIKTYFSTYMFK